ncbi:hypothetical protein [Leptospira santarosai]|uniref:hypothetical protein n=1 Tax=Leptospira santarosai TaxID=28183 RepID=UPI0024AF627A|nr:hypothetical protein [Leptospira santarosai]MDI7165917.1 hypothetical protein [Leptospira santarosai]
MSIVRKNLTLGRSAGKSLVVGMARTFDIFGVIDANGLRKIYTRTDAEIFEEDMGIIAKDLLKKSKVAN